MANLNDLLIPWSEKLPQEIQNLDFEISESFSSIGVDAHHLAHQSSVEIITTINEQIFNNLDETQRHYLVQILSLLLPYK